MNIILTILITLSTVGSVIFLFKLGSGYDPTKKGRY